MSTHTLNTWETAIRPYLTRIRWRSLGLKHDVVALAARPNFETMAEADLADVERELERALERIRFCRQSYNALDRAA
jgi:hypothetical protein